MMPLAHGCLPWMSESIPRRDARDLRKRVAHATGALWPLFIRAQPARASAIPERRTGACLRPPTLDTIFPVSDHDASTRDIRSIIVSSNFACGAPHPFTPTRDGSPLMSDAAISG